MYWCVYSILCMYVFITIHFYVYKHIYVGSTAAVSKDSLTVEPSTSEQVSEVIPSTPLGDAPIPDQPPTLPPLSGSCICINK